MSAPVITSTTTVPDPPAWARKQRALLADMEEAAYAFVQRYCEPDGTLRWKDHWPGMDGSDDPYEAFHDLPMVYLLGGGDRLLRLARRQWEAVTWQWTEYGQIHREFDAYYDWMHHGESNALFYLLGMADPDSLKNRTRAVRFADMYIGRDPSAPNYDTTRRLMRSPLNGSRGPRLEVSAEDWSTHREVLDGYPPPFDDIPGVDGPSCRWTDDAIFAEILERMNARMTRGDVPLNLTATSLGLHAYALTGDEAYRRWVLEYTQAWAQRARDNGGLVPDNVGPNGVIGENYEGRWWGGYYGWQWPHGAHTIIEPLGVSAANAITFTGDLAHLETYRTLADRLWEMGHEQDGQWVVPYKRTDAGWSAERPVDPRVPVVAWYTSLADEDAQRVLRISGSDGWGTPEAVRVKGNGAANSQHWFAYVHGQNAAYPEQILDVDRQRMLTRQEEIAADDDYPADWDVHHWQDKSPLFTEGLVQTMWGAPLRIYHGGLPMASVRYLDPHRRRPGLPPDLAALVEAVDAEGVTVTLVHCGDEADRDVVVQAGAFAQDRIVAAVVLADGRQAHPEEVPVDDRWLTVRLRPHGQLRLRLRIARHAYSPTYASPWTDADARVPLIRPRFAPDGS